MSPNRFPDVPSGYPFPALEQEVLRHWREQSIFERTLTRTAEGPLFVFFEGPPTANNKPHVGHVVTRVVKDLFPRFRTMQGYHVARKAGWDTHGLPVEIEVEKRLGFSGKKEIENYGIAAFNQACLESVQTYERDWRAMTERVGYWLDLDDAYLTYTNGYVESVWWALAELAKKGLLVEGHKSQPYCGRCGTTLSSHEVAQNYKDVDDPSIWVLFPVRAGQSLTTTEGTPFEVEAGFHIVAWTTTPWTLPGHAGLSVHPELDYRLVAHPTRPGATILFADAIAVPIPYETQVDGKTQRRDLRDQPALARFRGRDLAGLRYDRPFATAPADQEPTEEAFSPAPSDADGWVVVTADYVTASDGTGIVHTAPAFGADDYATGQKYGLGLYRTIDPNGKVAERGGIEPFAGLWFKDADQPVARNLKERGLVLHLDRYRHSYPFCWRCDSPLLQYATKSWFVRTTAEKAELVAKNREIAWHPAHVGEGRFGNWLENVVDWALSRRRYWGTPLPVWRCDDPACGELHVVGSYAELFALSGRPQPADPYDRRQFDPHRPYIDEVTWSCQACGRGTMRREEEVIDAWFDSGSMPFAQHHYPFENRELFARQFPADFISEAVDQTRGWFYTLHVLGVLLFDSVAYKNCIVLGHVSDEQGRKMSKRLGNVVDPMAVIEETGADALRWYFCVNDPEQTARFSARLVREAAQGFLLPLWNALSFFTIYANLDGWHPARAAAPTVAARSELDRWILLRLEQVRREVTGRLEGYDIAPAARSIEGLLDDLTNWYIRRSRGRFWAENPESRDKEAAYHTLYEVLATLARLIAPFTPFVADVLHGHLVRSQGDGAAASVHLESWPAERGEVTGAADASTLLQRMQDAQRVVVLGRAARNAHEIKTRQPLAGVTLVTNLPASFRANIERAAEIVQDELNVKQVRWAAERGEYVHHEVRPNFKALGKRLGPLMKAVKAALEAADGDQLVTGLERDGAIELAAEGQTVRLERDDLEIRLIEKEGLATAGDSELLVALDTATTPELVAEGLAREVVHLIQAERKKADLAYADRIRVRYRVDAAMAAAIDAHRGWIAGETLAVALDSAGEATGEPSFEIAVA